MKMGMALVTAAFVLAPTLGSAEGCNFGKQEQAMSCAAGTSYDSATQSCLPVST